MAASLGRGIVCLLPGAWSDGRDRTHQLLRRLAAERTVVAVEEPVAGGQRARLRLRCADDGLVLATPLLPRPTGTPAEPPLATLERLLGQLLRRLTLDAPWLWCTRPDHAPIALRYETGPVLYDRPDAWPWHTDFPLHALRAWDDVLASHATLVISDGPALPRGVAEVGTRRHLVRSGLDDEDPRPRTLLPPQDMPTIAAGGIAADLRDPELLAGLTFARPHWRFIVDPDPERGLAPPNAIVSELGHAPVPRLLRGCDVAMLPARANANGSARLWRLVGGLLARGVPVVTVPVPDLVHSLADPAVPLRFADGVSEFVAAAEELLTWDRARRDAGAETLRRRWSWTASHRQLARLLADAAPLPLAPAASMPLKRTSG